MRVLTGDITIVTRPVTTIDQADLQRAVAAHLGQKQRHEIGRAVHPDAHGEGKERAEREIAVEEGAQIDDRLAVGQHPPEKQSAAHDRDEHRDADRIVVEPVPARTFVERVFEAAEKGRHQEHAGQVKIAQQRQVGLVDIDRDPDHRGDRQAWDDVDQEQPMPGKRIGQKPAERRAQCRRQAEDDRDDRDDARQLPAAEFCVDDRPHASA